MAPARVRRAPRADLVVGVLALAGMGASFMQTILLPIQAELPELLGSTRNDTAWAITITQLVWAVSTPITGKLGDMYGKRRVVLALLGLLVAGSVVCALSPTALPLIVGRSLQGFGMGVIPLGVSILRDVLHESHLGSAIALVSASLGVGGALGLPISAFVGEHFDWHVLFWLAAGTGAVCLALVAIVIPPGTPALGGRVDIVGVAGLALGLSGVLVAISRGNVWGWVNPLTLGLALGGLAILLGWGWFELRVTNPLVDLRVSARGSVLLTNLASVAMGFALFSSNIAFPQLLELPEAAGGPGLSMVAMSFVLMPTGLVMLAMAPAAGRLELRVGPKLLFVAGAGVIAVAYLVSVLLVLQTWHILVINILIGIGVGLGFAAMPTLIMESVPDTETGAANGLNTLMRAMGTSVAAAAVAAVLARSVTPVGGTALPTTASFRTVFVFGLVASITCTAVAAFIPRPRHPPSEHPALKASEI